VSFCILYMAESEPNMFGGFESESGLIGLESAGLRAIKPGRWPYKI